MSGFFSFLRRGLLAVCLALLVWAYHDAPLRVSGARAQDAGPLAQGQAWYAAQRWSEAEAAFREAIRQQPESAPAYLWLGRTLGAQQNYKKAVEALKRAVKLDKTLTEAHIELARVYLQMDEKKDARKALDAAEKLDPDNPEVYYYRGMAYGKIRLAELRRGKVKEEFEIRRAAFQRAIDLKADHPDAYFQFGQAYEVALNDYESAIPLYEKQVSIRPDHASALRALVRAFIQIKQLERGITLFQRLADLHKAPDNVLIQGYAGQLHAYHYHSLGRHEEAYRSFERYLGVLESTDPEEAGLYRDLSLIVTADLLEKYKKGTEEERRKIWDAFWAARDPDPTTAINERLVEHYRRIMFARLNFSEGQSPWDRRGEIYIRFGDPDDRQHFLMRSGEDVAENYFPTGKVAVDAIRDRNRQQYKMQINTGGVAWSQEPMAELMTRQTQALAFAVESWVYVPFGLELFFADQLHNGKFDFPVEVTEMPAAGSNSPRTDRLAFQLFTTPRKQAEMLIQRVPEAYQFDYGGEPMAFVFDMAVFKGSTGRPEVEVAYSIPTSQLGSVEDGRGMETWFNGRIALRDSTLRHVTASAATAGPIPRPLSAKARTELQTTAFTFQAAPGTYRSALAVQDSASRRIGIYEAPTVISDYSGTGLQLSDIKLASSIAPTGETGTFVRHGLKIIPYPARMYPQTVPVYIYYEIYNLTPDAGGRTSYQMQLEIAAKEEQRNFAWRLLSSLGRLVTRSSDERSVVLMFEDAGAQKDEYKYTSIDTSESAAGAYTLTLTVTDLHSGQRAARSKDFIVVKN
jgi:GWxTD domain-containing protein